jgi:hypothetical protein
MENWLKSLLGILFVLPLALAAQSDTIPHIVSGQLDWVKYKQSVNAPVFQQNDMAVYILRKDSLGELISQEQNANWIRDFHFFDLNGDRQLDAVYSGSTRAKGGYYTYCMLADTGLRFPIVLEAPGYVHQLNPQPKGLELLLREDAHDKGYLHKISAYYLDFISRKSRILWQLQMLSTTEVPLMHAPQVFALHYPTELRTTPRILNTPPMDYDQNGQAESTGNVVASLAAETPGLALAEQDIDGQQWTFVIMLATPAKHALFQPISGVQMAYAGWVLRTAIEGK